MKRADVKMNDQTPCQWAASNPKTGPWSEKIRYGKPKGSESNPARRDDGGKRRLCIIRHGDKYALGAR